jgi:predicted CXXCH cytochrome family protein
VKDRYFGDFDYDGDGVAEELNVGCETCHGPGSAHWEQGGRGKHIVALNLLTPEREAMVCGQCHSRPAGKLGTDSPVDAAGRMMVAGTSRNDFLKNNAGGGAPAKLDAAPGDLWGDGAVNASGLDHSKAHHQQYTDFIKSKLYKNASVLMTCSGCHDPHRKTESARQLRKDPNDNVQLCGQCHGLTAANAAANLEAHVDEKLPGVGALHAGIGANCVDCHMPKTAQTGAAQPTLVGASSGTQYTWSDVTSHAFDMPRKAVSVATRMPTAYTNPCGACHTGSGM